MDQLQPSTNADKLSDSHNRRFSTTFCCTTERQSLCESHRQRWWLTCWS